MNTRTTKVVANAIAITNNLNTNPNEIIVRKEKRLILIIITVLFIVFGTSAVFLR